MSNEIFVVGTLTIGDQEYEFNINNNKDKEFNHDGLSELSHYIVADFNRALNKYGINKFGLMGRRDLYE